ncbi:hypothetical protein SY83_14960 [Paenibacillus swuensis]|uniref:DUF3397 domain-containing protein n=1 Tax=Paenibacillus swuensis TaxID=1178515 RepID=A0A172TKQ6_9BACL|nr:DUF3397 domain-containing protein [Paenibacillus swuensis]ANE47353.1 hypothetical protein SY83_14960 [Paenibacillus swuensis]
MFFEGVWTIFRFLAVVPFIPFGAAWLISYGIVKHRKKALMTAMDVTTVFLIVAVSALFNEIFTKEFGLYGILLFMLLTAGFIGNAQNRIKGKVNVPKLSKALWRFSFVVLSFFYILFMVLGIGKQFMSA